MADKGHVTRSLADGYARYSLRDVAQKARDVRTELGKEIKKHSTLPARKAGSRRVINRFHKKLAPLSLATCMLQSNDSMMGGWVLPDVVDKQLTATTLLLGVGRGGTLAIDAHTSMTITAHALGRMWQRTDINDLEWDTLRGLLTPPLMYSWAVIRTAASLGWERIALPCMDGLLVGKPDQGGLLLTTYLEPPLATKWMEVRQAFDSLMLEFTNIAQADEPSMEQITRMYKAGCVGLKVPEIEMLMMYMRKTFDKQDFQWMKLMYQGEVNDGLH